MADESIRGSLPSPNFCYLGALGPIAMTHQVDDPHPDELLAVSEEDEADDDVGGDDVQVAEELGQHTRDVAERTLQCRIKELG